MFFLKKIRFYNGFKIACIINRYLKLLYINKLNVDKAAFAIILGCLPLLVQSELINSKGCFFIIIFSLLLFLVPHSNIRFLAFILLFVGYSNSIALSLISRTNQLSDSIMTIETKIIEYRQLQDGNIIIKIAIPKESIFSSTIYANVYWRNPPKTSLNGQYWQFKIQFRAVHSYLNEGGFDSQKYGVSIKETLAGKVMLATLIDANISLRMQFIQYLSTYWEATKNKGEIVALVLGDKRQISAKQKDIYMKTGVAHLVVISGLHIGLSAFFGWFIARAIQFLFPIKWIGTLFPLIIGWSCGVIYAALSGWGIPAIRAIIGLSVWVLLHWRSRLFLPWQWALWSAALILIFEPLSILSVSFWLSFSAVFAIIFWYWMYPLIGTYTYQKRWFIFRLVHLQFGLMIILLPFQYYLFGGGNLFSFFANLWAVPIISFITVPLIMLGLFTSFMPFCQPVLWHLIDLSISSAFWCLPYFSSFWRDSGSIPFLLSLSGIVGILVIKMKWWCNHFILVIATGTLLYCEVFTSARYQWRMTMLDVGHGLAIIIENDGDAIIYDTGMRWKSGGSIAKRVIIPYLKSRRLTPSVLIISHDHLDHTGGVADLLVAYPQLIIRSSFNQPQHLPCLQGQSWQWKGLVFHALWPIHLYTSPKNNESCVINVSDGKQSILLTGDIEKESEVQLVRSKNNRLKADILQVPHHGSQTSSTLAFIQAVSPNIALVSAARYSPWRLPSDKVHRRYKNEAINWLTTSIRGQISIEFSHNKIDILTYRQDILPRWYNQWFGILTINE